MVGRGSLVLVKKSERLRGRFSAVISTREVQYVGIVVGFENYRNPYAGMGRAESHLYLANVVLIPAELQPQAALWSTAPDAVVRSIFSGKPIPAKAANLAEYDQNKSILCYDLPD